MKSFNIHFIGLIILLLWNSCNPTEKSSNEETASKQAPIEEATKEQIPAVEQKRLPVIFDTDANNELDDQHALAYLMLNNKTFDVKGITVNTTYNGGDIDAHYAEAERVLKLCDKENTVPLLKGANASFLEIQKELDKPQFDGYPAVNFIINTAKKYTEEKLVLIAVGKLTNIALALQKEPSISKNIRLVWLGANYPESGEYNLENDIPAMNYLLDSDMHFEMVTVRYGDPTGTDAVKVTQDEINKMMPGLGIYISEPVVGRHGKSFNNFGDYSVSLFENIDYYGDPPSRALFDMAAVAIVKNKDWATASSIPCPIMKDEKWVERKDNPRKIMLWENFDRDKIMNDFYSSF